MPRLHLVASLAVLGLAACSSPSPRNATAHPDKIPAPAPVNLVQAGIVAVSERGGEVLAEIPLGSADNVEPGTLLRVYADQTNHNLLKGMLQVTEVLGAHRAIARGIGLTDRANPLKVGDVARLTDLTATLADYRAQLTTDTKLREQKTSDDDATFARLRDQYQAELAAAQVRLDQQLVGEQAAHDRAVADLLARQKQAEQRKEAEHQADRTALSASMREQAATAIAADRAERDQKLRDTQAENQRLTAHTERVVTELQRCQLALTKAKADLAANDAEHAKAVRLEVETRQVLQKRLSELEQRLNGKPVSSVAVLSNDPSRSETVLAQLERLTGELALARAEQDRLGKALADSLAANEAVQRDLDAVRAQAAQLPEAKQAGQTALSASQAAETNAAKAREQAAIHERARLAAERQLYDLASRVLALDGKPESVAELQHRLQQLVAATAGDQP